MAYQPKPAVVPLGADGLPPVPPIEEPEGPAGLDQLAGVLLAAKSRVPGALDMATDIAFKTLVQHREAVRRAKELRAIQDQRAREEALAIKQFNIEGENRANVSAFEQGALDRRAGMEAYFNQKKAELDAKTDIEVAKIHAGAAGKGGKSEAEIRLEFRGKALDDYRADLKDLDDEFAALENKDTLGLRGVALFQISNDPKLTEEQRREKAANFLANEAVAGIEANDVVKQTAARKYVQKHEAILRRIAFQLPAEDAAEFINVARGAFPVANPYEQARTKIRYSIPPTQDDIKNFQVGMVSEAYKAWIDDAEISEADQAALAQFYHDYKDRPEFEEVLDNVWSLLGEKIAAESSEDYDVIYNMLQSQLQEAIEQGEALSDPRTIRFPRRLTGPTNPSSGGVAADILQQKTGEAFGKRPKGSPRLGL